MTLLRSIALLAFAGFAPLASHAEGIPAGTVATTPSGNSANSPSLYSITRGLAMSRKDDLTPVHTPTSIYASGPNTVGDAVQSLRPFTISGENADTATAGPVPEDVSPTPEPAGLFLLGSGAFATALTIRYRLFSL